MKKCLNCKFDFELESWTCPHCDFSPSFIGNFPLFSPALSEINDGQPKNSHHLLNHLQADSFWFRGRNQLIKNMISAYFPDAVDVMEIGCGSGYVLNGIREVLPLAKLTATELYLYALNYASKTVTPPSRFIQLDARELPFKQEFDLIGAFDVLEHIAEHKDVIVNIKNALKLKGGIIVTVPQHPWLWSQADDFACHKRRYTRKELTTLLKNEGFEILLDTSFMFFLLPVLLMKRLMIRKNNYDFEKELVLPRFLDGFFEYILKLEMWAIKYGVRFPVGGSRLVVARLQ